MHKHAALAALLAHMTLKPRPITYVETHAGRGLYDLAAPEALKTGEAASGILRIEADRRLPPDHPYARALAGVRRKHGRNAYPGSPLLAAGLLRPGDVMHLAELHPGEFKRLERCMGDSGAKVRREDGFAAALALAPPTPKSGLVLVDPSYEVKSEYAAAAEFVIKLHRKWPEAVIVLWYPVLAAGLHRAMVGAIEAAGLPRVSGREAMFADPAAVRGMYGSGILVVNAPHGVGDDLKFAQKLAGAAPGR